MKVVRVETIRLDEFPNLLFVRLHTDEGPVGLGETFFGAQAVEAFIHETAAARILGADPLRIKQIARSLVPYVGYQGGGAELRGLSAVDIALWDIHGKASGLPLHAALGGASRDAIRVYNTCAGYRYIRTRPVQAVDNWGLPVGAPEGPYEDLDAFLNRADELALSLLDEGITGMKIWPFDAYAEAGNGTVIRAEDLDRALEPLRKIRSAVGARMDVMVELHGLWSLPAARRIVRALDEFQPSWIEDPVRPDGVDSLAEIAASTSIPIATGETLAGLASFRELLARRGAGVVILDVSWVGGISEALKIGALAESCGVPVAPHDCTGPVVLTASTHLSIHLPNAILQETVRAYYRGWYGELVTELPPIENGHIRPPAGPGLGTELQPDVPRRRDAHVRESVLQ